jgi:hypothetical protein
MPSAEVSFRNFILNQRIETMEHFIAPSLWKSCMGPSPQLKGRRCWGGLDLGATRDSLRDQCNTKAAGLPFFVKQMTTGWIPPDLQFRELPRWQR